MTYVKTTLQHSIDIDAIITLHYFEYMKNFEFKGESHNFWEFLYVDKGTVAVRADDTWTTLYTGDIIFHQPNEFHAITLSPSGKIHPIWSSCLSLPVRRPCLSS